MLTELTLDGFKGYSRFTRFPLRPITLVYGPNSAGKSAMLHAIALISQSVMIDSDRPIRSPAKDQPEVLNFGGTWVDLGDYGSTVNGHDLSRNIQIGLGTDSGRNGRPWSIAHLPRNGKLFGGVTLELAATSPEVTSIQIRFGTKPETTVTLSRPYGGSLLKFSDSQGLRQLTWCAVQFILEGQSAVDRGGATTPGVSDVGIARKRRVGIEVISDAFHKRLQARQGDEDASVSGAEELAEFSPKSGSDREAMDLFEHALQNLLDKDYVFMGLLLGPSFNGRHRLPGDANVRDLQANLPEFVAVLVEGVLKDVWSDSIVAARSFHYLGPLRAAPLRFERKSSQRNVGSQGEFTTQVLAGSQRLREQVNKWLGRMGVPYSIDIKTVTNQEFPTIPELLVPELTDLRTGVKVSPANVGFGLSQLLPVVVACLSSRKHLLVEQPELHLHPRLQGDVADLFVEAAYKGGQVIAETHSEAIILRLLRRIRTGDLAPGFLSVLYVGADDDIGSWVKPLRVNTDGEFDDEWPEGFFEERWQELI